MGTEQNNANSNLNVTDKMTEKKKYLCQSKQCSAVNCKNYQSACKEVAFHRFPKDPSRCARWVQNLRNASLTRISCERLHQIYRVCSAHFHPSQFKRPSNVHCGLNWNAVPTRVDAPDPPLPLDLELPPKKRQELRVRRHVDLSSAESVQLLTSEMDVSRPDDAGEGAPTETSTRQSRVVHSSSTESVQQPNSQPDVTRPDQTVAGPSIQPVPLLQLTSSLPHPAAAAKECALKKKIRSLQSQVCKLKARVCELKQHNKRGVKASVLMQLKKLLPAKAYAFVSTQVRMSQRKAHGLRWTTRDKAFFSALFQTSPKCYKLLSTVFSMPSVRTLQKLMASSRSIDFKPGFNQHVLDNMKKAVENTNATDKVCVIMTGEMSLKEAIHCSESAGRVEGLEDFREGQHTPCVANNASAFMVRGLFRNWKQLFGYCFTSGPIPHTRLRSLLLEAISELRKTGMECLVFICDQGAGNCSMLADLGVTKEKPYFELDAIRVFCLWDPPCLIKNIRDNWRNHGFTLDGGHITWATLEDLYTYDSKQDIRLCCRLTTKHVYLPSSASSRVKFATQVLSHSVAVGIKTLALIKQLTGQTQRNYMAAAQFCENFDGIFNCFNSKQLKDSHKLKSALSDRSAHFPFLEKCMEWLPRLQLVDRGKKIPCVEGWQHNIVCLKMIWCDVRGRYQVSHLLTNHLNQGCLESAYTRIRARGGNRGSLDSIQLEGEYRNTLATGLMLNNPENTDCEQDLDTILLQFSTDASSSTGNTLDEHCYARATTDAGGAGTDSAVAALVGAEDPMVFGSQTTSFYPGDHGKGSDF